MRGNWKADNYFKNPHSDSHHQHDDSSLYELAFMKPDVYIRADGSAQLGLGHLVRSSSLAQYLKNSFGITFVCLEIPAAFKKELQSAAVHVNCIEREEDFARTISRGSIIVLDGYQFSADYQRKLKKKGNKVVYIDDYHTGEYFADLVINHAPGLNKDDFRALPYTEFALGPEYALLRPAFIKAANENRKINELTSVLICFGGSDVKNLTKQTFEVVQNFKQFKKITIITGSVYEHDLDTDKLKDAGIQHYRAVSENQMANLMMQSDLAIVPASGILFEALAAGCEVISGYYNKNQVQTYNGFKQVKAFTDAGTFQSDELFAALSKVKPHHKEKIIDGKSPQRFVELFKELSQKKFETI